MKYVKTSKDRIENICPYFNQCGGCNLLHLSYEDTLLFKNEKIKSLLEKAKIEYKKEIGIIKNENPFYYRNKISMKIENGKIGFYKDNTHELVEIKKCFLAKEPINEVIKNYKLLNLLNANLTIRCNSNDEILLIIESEEKNYNIELARLKEKIKLVNILFTATYYLKVCATFKPRYNTIILKSDDEEHIISSDDFEYYVDVIQSDNFKETTAVKFYNEFCEKYHIDSTEKRKVK